MLKITSDEELTELKKSLEVFLSWAEGQCLFRSVQEFAFQGFSVFSAIATEGSELPLGMSLV